MNEHRQKLYYRYYEMLKRAERKNLSVSSAWLGPDGRESFIEWSLNNGFSPELDLDRRKNELGYSPENCQYITRRENTSKEKRSFEWQGKLYTKVELIEQFGATGMSKQCFQRRLNLGWPLDKALLTPVGVWNG